MLRFAIFIAIFCAIMGLMSFVVGQRLMLSTLFSESSRPFVWLVVALLGLATMVSFMSGGSERLLVRVIAWIGYTWLGLLFIMFTTTLLLELPRLLLHVSNRGKAGVISAERRAFFAEFAAVAIMGAGLVATGLGLRGTRPPISITRTSIRVGKRWRSTKAFRIVQLSDVHVGKTVRASFIDAVVAQVNELEADAVVITGDLVDGSVAVLGDIVKRLSNMKSNHGLFFVTGNHEYYSGAGSWKAFMSQIGFEVLGNRHQTIGQVDRRIVLAGVNDLYAKGFGDDAPDYDLACDGCDTSLPIVMLAHQPKQLFDALESKLDVMLSGHTHGGQIFPFNFLVKLQQPFNHGLHSHAGKQIYVSRGTGYWGPPLRIGAPAEIAVLDISGEEEALA